MILWKRLPRLRSSNLLTKNYLSRFDTEEKRSKFNERVWSRLRFKMLDLVVQEKLDTPEHAFRAVSTKIIEDAVGPWGIRDSEEYRMDVEVFKSLTPEETEQVMANVAFRTGFDLGDVRVMLKALEKELSYQ